MKVVQDDLLFVCNQGSLVGQCMQDYKCLVYSWYDLCHPVCPKFWFVILTLLIPKSKSNPGICCTHVR